jgi:hypothetical protein
MKKKKSIFKLMIAFGLIGIITLHLTAIRASGEREKPKIESNPSQWTGSFSLDSTKNNSHLFDFLGTYSLLEKFNVTIVIKDISSTQVKIFRQGVSK